jgi:hypothetical protein
MRLQIQSDAQVHQERTETVERMKQARPTA